MSSSVSSKRAILIVIAALAVAGTASGITKQKTKSNNTNERPAAETTGSDAASGGVRQAVLPVSRAALRVGTRAGTNGNEVAVALSGGAAFAWNPATGAIDPVPVDNTNPIQGIGVVVKKNPGSSAARTLPVKGDGTVELPADLEEGRYDFTVSVPRQTTGLTPHAKGRMAEAGSFALVLVKNSDGFALTSNKRDSPRDSASGLATGKRAATMAPASSRGMTAMQPQADNAITTKGTGAN